MATATIKLLSTEQIITAELEIMNNIRNGIWINSKNEKITLFPYNENNLYFCFENDEKIIGKEVTIKICDSYTIYNRNLFLWSKKYKINNTRNRIKIEDLSSLFRYGFDYKKEKEKVGILNLYVSIEFEKEEFIFPKEKENYLTIHFIQFIPRIMEAQSPKWIVASKFQNFWFREEANSEPWKRPILNELSLDWVLNFGRQEIQETYENLIHNLWKTPNAIKELKKMIKRMTEDPFIKLEIPLKEEQTIPFGVRSSEIKTYDSVPQPKLNGALKKETMPLFERFYYTSVSYRITDLKKFDFSEPLDDLFGTLASFSFHVLAIGSITKKEKNYSIKITEIGIYIKDSFDFITDNEPLGHWSFYYNSIYRINPLSLAYYFVITNKSYRDYRKDYKKGSDFTIYSDIKYIPVNYTFISSYEEISK